MKKYFVVSDVHSYYSLMMKELTAKGFDIRNKNHILISCGDMFDRGPESSMVLEFVNKLPKSRKILIRGNHEDLLQSCIKSKEFTFVDLQNGTVTTAYDLCEKDLYKQSNVEDKEVLTLLENDKKLAKYYSCLRDYAEIGPYVFVHGWIPSLQYKEASKEEWIKSRWLNGMEEWRYGVRLENKTIVCGHWNCSYGWSRIKKEGREFPSRCGKGWQNMFRTFMDNGIIALDGCTAWSGVVNVFTFEL